MDQLLPLVTVTPLLMAAAIAALNPLLGRARRVLDGVAIVTSAAVAGLLVAVLLQVAHQDQLYWFAGFPWNWACTAWPGCTGPCSAPRSATGR